MRAVEHDAAPMEEGFAEAIDSCVGCMACETACPSGVSYGDLLERTTAVLATGHTEARVRWWQRWGLSMLDRPRAVRAGVVAVALAQRVGFGRLAPLSNLPRLPLRQQAMPSDAEGLSADPPRRDEVVLLTGCVMDATLRRVHVAAARVLRSVGFTVLPQPSAGCCGALASHAGLHGLAERQLTALARVLPPEVPIISDSAGCGASILRAGRRAETDLVADMAARTVDVSTFLLANQDRLPPPPAAPIGAPVAIATPCHLRNIQGAQAADAVPELLGRYVRVVSTADDDLCCGAGGSYSVRRPHQAAVIRDAKIEALRATGAPVVASANPGCAMHLEAGGMLVQHPVEILDRVWGTTDGGHEE